MQRIKTFDLFTFLGLRNLLIHIALPDSVTRVVGLKSSLNVSESYPRSSHSSFT